MRSIGKLGAILLLATVFTACDADTQGDASATLDTVGSKIEQGAEKIGNTLDTAVSNISADTKESRIEGMLHNIKGLEGVEVDMSTGGDVTLIGSVESEDRRMEAERIVRQMEGVNTVVNAIKIGSAVPNSRDTIVLDDTSRTP